MQHRESSHMELNISGQLHSNIPEQSENVHDSSIIQQKLYRIVPCIQPVLHSDETTTEPKVQIQLEKHFPLMGDTIRNEVFKTALSEYEWDKVHLVLEMGVSQYAKELAVRKAAENEQWIWVMGILRNGKIRRNVRDKLCHLAVRQRQWWVVQHLLAIGVDHNVTREVLSTAASHGRFEIANTILEQGASSYARQLCLSQAIQSDQWEFVKDVIVRHFKYDTKSVKYVLSEAVRKCHWCVISQLLESNIGLDILLKMCEEAICDEQFDLVLDLISAGVCPESGTFDIFVLKDLGQRLYQLSTTVKDPINRHTLKIRLLGSSLRYNQSDIFTQLLSLNLDEFTDEELTRSITFGILQYKDNQNLLVDLIKTYGRVRQLFRHKARFAYDSRGGKMSTLVCSPGVFDALLTSDELELALHIAIDSYKGGKAVLADLFRGQPDIFDARKRVFKTAAKAIIKYDDLEILNRMCEPSVCKKWKQNKRLFFLLAARLGNHKAVIHFRGRHIGQKTLQKARHWIMARLPPSTFPKILRKLCNKDSAWFHVYALQRAMEECIDTDLHRPMKHFTLLFTEYCTKENAHVLQEIFNTAVERTLREERFEAFGGFCHAYFEGFSQIKVRSLDWEEDLKAAYTKALKTGYCRVFFNFAKLIVSTTEADILFETLLEKGAWDVLSWFHINMQSYTNNNCSKILNFCICWMLRYETSQTWWPDCAKVLNGWITSLRHDGFWDPHKEFGRANLEGDKVFSPQFINGVAEWCLKNNCSNLAMFLAVALRDYKLMRTIVDTGEDLSLPIEATSYIINFLMGTRTKPNFILAVDLFISTPVSEGSVSDSFDRIPSFQKILRYCLDHGSGNWSLVAACYFFKWPSVRERVESGVKYDEKALEFVLLRVAVFSSRTMECVLKTRQIKLDERCLTKLSHRIVSGTLTPYRLKVFLKYIDPSGLCNRCLISKINYSRERVKLLQMCLSAGLFSWQRLTKKCDDCLQYTAVSSSDIVAVATVTRPVEKYKLEFAQLAIGCGVFDHQRLHKARTSAVVKTELSISETRKEAYSMICKAAATPFTLQHLSRLAVSASIGCRPGRAERISSLALPQVVVDFINFKDSIRPCHTNNEGL